MSIQFSKDIVTKFLSEKEYYRLIRGERQKAGKINSVSNLLLTNDSNLLIISDHEKINYKKLIELKEFYRELYLNNGFTLENITKSNHSIRLCSTFSRLNEIFANLSARSIIEVNGSTCSGKTQLILDITFQSLLKCKQKILFIDIDLSFPDQKCNQMLKSKGVQPTLIQILRVFTIEDLFNLLEKIKNDTNWHNSLLIIDSLSSILFTIPLLGKERTFKKDKLRILSEMAQLLQSAAYNANLIIIYSILSLNDCKLNLSDQITPRLILKLERNDHIRKVILLNNSFHAEIQEEIVYDDLIQS